MTTEDDFQRALDADPSDWMTRLVFADWLDERNDPRAEGMRALGSYRCYPAFGGLKHRGGNGYVYLDESEGGWKDYAYPALPADWFAILHDSSRDKTRMWAGYTDTRREVENLAALAFSRLPAARRAELLAPTIPNIST